MMRKWEGQLGLRREGHTREDRTKLLFRTEQSIFKALVPV